MTFSDIANIFCFNMKLLNIVCVCVCACAREYYFMHVIIY